MTSEGDYFMAHRWVEETRDPLLTVSYGANVFHLYCFSIIYWAGVLALVHLCLVPSCITAWILDKVVVAPKQSRTPTAYLLGYGALLPVWAIMPRFLVLGLGVDNLLIRFVLGGIVPTLAVFRILETIHGFTPPTVLKHTSFYKGFPVYFISPIIWKRDAGGDPVRANFSGIAGDFVKFLFFLTLTGMHQSWLSLYPDFIVFGSVGPSSENYLSIENTFSLSMIGNNFLVAVLFWLYMTTYCQGLAVFTSMLTMYQMEPVMDNPLFASKSPSDFWGRRWNRLVHSVLKGGVYKPMRRATSSHALGMIASFLASGLLHEWLLVAIFTEDQSYRPHYGGAMVFFSWQGALLALEMAATAAIPPKVQSAWSHRVPGILRTMIVVLLGIPTAHYFTEPYIATDYFYHGQTGVPFVKVTQQAVTERATS